MIATPGRIERRAGTGLDARRDLSLNCDATVADVA